MSFTTNLLWQNDPRWANTPLGFGPQTISQWGCLTTSLAMLVNGCGYNETPATLSQKMTAIRAFNGAAINAYRIGEAFPGVAMANLVDCTNVAAPLTTIDAELAGNKPVLVCVDQSPASGIQDHWVLLYAKSGSDYLMLDPWDYSGDAPGKANLLTKRYNHNGGTPEKEITQVIFINISGKPTPSSSPVPATTISTPQPAAPVMVRLPSDSLNLIPTTDGLAFRGAPDMTGPLLRRFPLGTTLHSLESAPATIAKIGSNGQWINVQAPEGDQGFVAAWYVSSANAASQPVPAPSGNISSVTVTTDQLAFRSSPVLGDNNLIERLPVGIWHNHQELFAAHPADNILAAHIGM